MILAIILTFVLVFPAGLILGSSGRRNEQRRLAAVPPAPNVFGEIILPEPSDPRWRRKVEVGCAAKECNMIMLQLGAVHACVEHGVRVNGLNPACSQPSEEQRLLAYVRAVRTCYMANTAMHEIETHDPLSSM